MPSIYAAGKAALMSYTRSMAAAFVADGIRVNAIAPGPFVTNIGDGWAKKDPVVKAAFDATIPLGAMAETHQMKPLALYLASDASSFMTGSTLLIDGGVLAAYLAGKPPAHARRVGPLGRLWRRCRRRPIRPRRPRPGSLLAEVACPSGLRSTPRKRVWGNPPPRVQIPPPPP